MAKAANDFNRSTKGEVGPSGDRNAASGWTDAELDAMGPGVSDDGRGPPEIEETQTQTAFERFANRNFAKPNV